MISLLRKDQAAKPPLLEIRLPEPCHEMGHGMSEMEQNTVTSEPGIINSEGFSEAREPWKVDQRACSWLCQGRSSVIRVAAEGRPGDSEQLGYRILLA